MVILNLKGALKGAPEISRSCGVWGRTWTSGSAVVGPALGRWQLTTADHT